MRTDIITVGARIARFEEPWFCKSCLFHFIIRIISCPFAVFDCRIITLSLLAAMAPPSYFPKPQPRP